MPHSFDLRIMCRIVDFEVDEMQQAEDGWPVQTSIKVNHCQLSLLTVGFVFLEVNLSHLAILL